MLGALVLMRRLLSTSSAPSAPDVPSAGEDFLSALPEELRALLVSLLSINDAARLASTARLWRASAASPAACEARHRALLACTGATVLPLAQSLRDIARTLDGAFSVAGTAMNIAHLPSPQRFWHPAAGLPAEGAVSGPAAAFCAGVCWFDVRSAELRLPRGVWLLRWRLGVFQPLHSPTPFRLRAVATPLPGSSAESDPAVIITTVPKELQGHRRSPRAFASYTPKRVVQDVLASGDAAADDGAVTAAWRPATRAHEPWIYLPAAVVHVGADGAQIMASLSRVDGGTWLHAVTVDILQAVPLAGPAAAPGAPACVQPAVMGRPGHRLAPHLLECPHEQPLGELRSGWVTELGL